jgi:hypothetical protein
MAVALQMRLTPFESEILDSILWQVEGFKSDRVTRRATMRFLRATVRRMRPRLIARSQATESADRVIDHAIPVLVFCEHLLTVEGLDRSKLEKIVTDWLVTVELTAQEHREVLQKCGLADCMPDGWDGADPLARYRIAGIQLLKYQGEMEDG